MKSVAKQRREARTRRKARVRKRVRGSNETPRLSIYKSLNYTYAQLVSDEGSKVIAAASTKQCVVEGASASSVASAKALGIKIAEIAKEKQIAAVVFDRCGYRYHGRVAAVADGAREGGLQF